MIRFSLKGIVSLAIAGLATACSPEHESQSAPVEWNLVGEYLGQQPPGSEVELFAPGYISTSMSEANSVFSPDGSEFFFAVWPGPGHDVTVFSTHVEDGRWTIPEVPDFLRGVSAIDVAMTADGQRFFFCSNRSRTPGGPTEDNFDIWYVDRESDGHWGEPINPGEPLNSDRADYCPMLSPDGRYLFFSSNRISPESAGTDLGYQTLREINRGPGGGFSDVYWVDASIIEKPRQQFFQSH